METRQIDRSMDLELGAMSLLAGTSQRSEAFCPASLSNHGHISFSHMDRTESTIPWRSDNIAFVWTLETENNSKE
jgi:hypothetical protein